MTDKLRSAFDRAWKGAEHRSWVRGIIGRPDGAGGYDIAVADRPPFVYVRVSQEGSQTVTIAKSLGKVALRGNLPVRMRLEAGQYVIYEVDSFYYDAATADDASNLFGVPQHTHSLSSGMAYLLESQRLQPGLVRPGGGWDAIIEPMRYYDGSAWQTFPGDTLSLETNQPSTTGKHRLVVVVLDPSTNTVAAVNGSDENYATALDQESIDAITIGDTYPLGAVLIRADDADIMTQAKYIDARGWLNYARGVTFDDTEGDPEAIGTAAVGTSDFASRHDHVHALSTATVGGVIFSDAEGQPADVGTTADGTSTFAARRDHVHALAAGGVANTHLADMTAGTIKGRALGAGTGAPTDLSAGQAAAIVGTAALDVDTGSLGNVGTGEDTVASYTVPANTLAANGDSLWFEAFGTAANNANTKALRVYFGAALIMAASDDAWGLEWVLRGRVIRTGAATQKAYVTLTTSAPIGIGSLAGGAGVTVSAAEDLTGAVALAITAEATADNDLICDGMIAGKTPA
jgi:hypothetical protein